MKSRSPFTLTLTVISAIVTTTVPAVFAQQQPSANQIYIDKNCQRNQQLPQLEKFTIFSRNEFTTNGQNYWFYAARYQDGGVLICSSKPNFNQPKPINEPKIQANFIDKILRDPNNKTAFIILVREGNGPPGPRDKLRLKFEQCRSRKTHLPFHPQAAANPQRRPVPTTHISRTGRSIYYDRPQKQSIRPQLNFNLYLFSPPPNIPLHTSAFIRVHPQSSAVKKSKS
jgi:hypothetical protein